MSKEFARMKKLAGILNENNSPSISTKQLMAQALKLAGTQGIKNKTTDILGIKQDMKSKDPFIRDLYTKMYGEITNPENTIDEKDIEQYTLDVPPNVRIYTYQMAGGGTMIITNDLMNDEFWDEIGGSGFKSKSFTPIPGTEYYYASI